MEEDVWASLDREYLADVARSGPPCIFATVSGAHLYGFASPDSDVDLRGAFLLPARDVLGLEPAQETISVTDHGRFDLDWVAHDLRKFARMMTRHNGYVLEQLFSSLVVVTSPAHDELRALGKGCVTRPTMRHYRGFAHGRRKRLHEPDATVKHLLYAYRVLLTGIHLLKTGEVVSHLPTLNDGFQVPQIDELVSRKRQGRETMLLVDSEIARHDEVLNRLESDLEKAHEQSTLPVEPATGDALEEFVIRLRLEGQ